MLKNLITLQAHERGHRGELPYVCEVCGKGYRISNNLTSHREETCMRSTFSWGREVPHKRM